MLEQHSFRASFNSRIAYKRSLCKEDGDVKAYGAGLLSSFGEMEYACSPTRPAGGTEERPNLLPWDPPSASELAYPLTTYQPTYFVAESMEDAKEKMIKFCNQYELAHGKEYFLVPTEDFANVRTNLLKLLL